MNYELAKELKEAGFPITKVTWTWKTGDVEGEHLPNPSLSELIETCGKDNEKGEFTLYWDLKEWVSGYYEDTWGEPRQHNIEETGSTPEESVARLWLALNKK